MSERRVQIGELHIRVPGLSSTDAYALARQVAAELAADVAAGCVPRRSLSSVSVKLEAPSRAAAVPGEIANAILRSLQ